MSSRIPSENTDRELWREKPDDFYSPSLHVTSSGGIGINVGGKVIVRPVREWHAAAMTNLDDEEPVAEEWLRSIGWTKDVDHSQKWTINRHDAMSIGLWIVDDGWKVMLIYHPHAQSCIVRGLKTRADVRLLCKALGIKLK